MSTAGEPTRRRFLTSALGGPLAAPQILRASATPPSDRVTVALIGSGGRGVGESKSYFQFDNCEIVAVCDVQETRRTQAKQLFEKLYAERKPGYQGGIRAYNDFREVLNRKDIDAVYIATADHWHVPITLAALAAGKDCHTEKPLGLTIEHDLAALDAVRKHRRIFQYGTERRSTPDSRHAIELVLNGRIGEVRKIYVVSPGSETGGSAAPVLPVPRGFDYDFWLGPAPESPFCRDRCLESGQRNGIFHIRDYALGFIAGWAAHPLDQVQWWADHSGLAIPVAYEGTGKLPADGLFNCACRWDLRCTYANGLVMHFMDDETYKTKSDAPHPDLAREGVNYVHNAAIFVGSKGWVAIAYEKVVTNPAALFGSEIGPNEIHLHKSRLADRQVPGRVQSGVAAHHQDWIDSIRTRKPAVSPIESAVHSDLVSQLSDICIRTGRTIHWDPARRTITGDEDARRMMSRPMRKPWMLV
ncbi:MAG: Gfo/Idh/MocA family oxidoreductase [Acidobacteria bacterium]|nr:Gfo/Idh/MocA family oxidoreductase [Acidobacteriota bacterium]